MEISDGDLVWRSLTEIFPGDGFYRELVVGFCQECSWGALEQRPCEVNKDLAQRSFIESLNRDLA